MFFFPLVFFSLVPVVLAQPTNAPTVVLSTCADPLVSATGPASCHADGYEYKGIGTIIATGAGTNSADYMFSRLGSSSAQSNYAACAAWVTANRSQKDYFGFVGFGILEKDANGILYDIIMKSVGTASTAWLDCIGYGETLAATAGAMVRSAFHNPANHNCYLAFDYGSTAAGKAEFLNTPGWSSYSYSSTGSGPPGALTPGAAANRAFQYLSGATRRSVGYTYNNQNFNCYVYWADGEAPSGGLSGGGSGSAAWTHTKSAISYTATEAHITGTSSAIFEALTASPVSSSPTTSPTSSPSASSPTVSPKAVVVIKAIVRLSITLVEWKTSVRARFISVLAAKLGVTESHIKIMSATETSSARRRRRLLATTGVDVTFEVEAEENSAPNADPAAGLQTSVAQYLNDDTTEGFAAQLDDATPSVGVGTTVVEQPTVVHAQGATPKRCATPFIVVCSILTL